MREGLRKLGFVNVSVTLGVLVITALSYAIFSYYVIEKNKKLVSRITGEINPYLESLDEFNLLVTESKMYTTNWVYLTYSETDKTRLRELHEKSYPALKQKLIAHLRIINRKANTDSLNHVFDHFESLLAVEQQIMQGLIYFDDYENPTKRFRAEETVETEVLPRTDVIMERLRRLREDNKYIADEMQNQMLRSFNRLRTGIFALSAGMFVFVVVASIFISRSIHKPVTQMKDTVLLLGKGKLPENELNISDNVIGDMAAAVNTLSRCLIKTSSFADEIGKGNLTADFTPISEQDTLGNALINMRNSLRTYSENMEQQVAQRTKEVVEKSEKLEVAYKEIRNSINYARRIQEAISPSPRLVYDVFKNSFIYYKPKDVISGDFYWFSHNAHNAIIAAVDCTGHGVPGALMTVIGNSLLNQIVNLGGMQQPGEILTQLDRRVLETFNTHGYEKANDGMDIALCHFDLKKKTVSFSGAKRSMYLFREHKLTEIKGSKVPIGSFQYGFDKNFAQTSIHLQHNDTVYIFSDGFQDQFGGPNGKKFLIRRFKKLLTDIQPLTMEEQARKLDHEMTEWKGTHEQTDDILVIGIRI